MSDLITVQNCVSNQPYHHHYVLSRSEPGKVYAVVIPFPHDPREEWICDCKGFLFRGYCRHIDTAPDPCHWQELKGPEQQTEPERATKTCPRCGNDTVEEHVLT